MRGSHFHGYDDEGEYAKKMVWSVDDCQRNRFQIGYLCGEDVYAWFDRPLVRHEYRPLTRGGVPQTFMSHQADMSDAGLTYHYQIFGAEMGTGKTLAAQMVIEKSGVNLVWWAGPKTSIPNIKREFKLWGFPFDRIQVEFFTYEGLARVMDEWDGSQTLPRFFVADESSRCKNDTSQRSKACQKLADLIREKYGYEGYVIEMSGTPSPKTPCDWWSQCEIAWPGYLKEGSRRAMEERLAFMVEQQFDAGKFKKRIGWKDDERKCGECGDTYEEGPHELDGVTDPDEYHKFVPSTNEVAYLYQRLKGLVIVKHKKDCLHLPEKRYRKVVCKPTASVLRVAQSIAQAAPNAVTGMTLLRELSDGFQYREVQDGMTACTHCTDGTVAEWVDPDDPEATYEAIDMLDADLVARLVKKTVPCPLCNGKREVPRWCASRGSALSEGRRPEDAAGRERGSRAAGDFCRLHWLRRPHRQAVPQAEVGRGAMRPGQLPNLHSQERQPGRCRDDRRRAVGLLGQSGRAQQGCLRGQSRVGRHESDVGGSPHGGVLVQLVEAGVPRAKRGSHPSQGHGREPGMHHRGPDPSAQRQPRAGRDSRQPQVGVDDDGRNPPRRRLAGCRRRWRNLRGGGRLVNPVRCNVTLSMGCWKTVPTFAAVRNILEFYFGSNLQALEAVEPDPDVVLQLELQPAQAGPTGTRRQCAIESQKHCCGDSSRSTRAWLKSKSSTNRMSRSTTHLDTFRTSWTIGNDSC